MNKFLLNYIAPEYIEIDFPSPYEEAFFMDMVQQKFYTGNNYYLLVKDDILTILLPES